MIAILARLLGPKIAEQFGPLIVGGLKLALIGMVYFYGVGEGKEAIRNQIVAATEKARAEEEEKFIARQRAANAGYERALELAASASAGAPQIIREIRNASPTDCSGVPIGVDRVRLLNRSLAPPDAFDTGAR